MRHDYGLQLAKIIHIVSLPLQVAISFWDNRQSSQNCRLQLFTGMAVLVHGKRAHLVSLGERRAHKCKDHRLTLPFWNHVSTRPYNRDYKHSQMQCSRRASRQILCIAIPLATARDSAQTRGYRTKHECFCDNMRSADREMHRLSAETLPKMRCKLATTMVGVDADP